MFELVQFCSNEVQTVTVTHTKQAPSVVSGRNSSSDHVYPCMNLMNFKLITLST